MPRPAASQPTEVELQILRILWRTGGATARQVHDALARIEKKSTNYSTAVKMLAVMLDKGLVKRDEKANPHVYRAAASRRTTQLKMLGRLIEEAYDGSALSLVLQALSSRRPSREELAEVRKLLGDLEKRS